jgi:hydrogenase maturation protease
MGENPGSVKKLLATETKFLKANVGVSLHGYSLSEIWQIAQSMGVKNNLSVIGVEPNSMEFNSGLSGVVKNSIPIILRMVAEEVKKNAEKDSHN